MTLGDYRDGLPAGYGIKVRTKTGRWSKVYAVAGAMWRPRGHMTFVSDRPGGGEWVGNTVRGRRYLPADTEVVLVRVTP